MEKCLYKYITLGEETKINNEYVCNEGEILVQG